MLSHENLYRKWLNKVCLLLRVMISPFFIGPFSSFPSAFFFFLVLGEGVGMFLRSLFFLECVVWGVGFLVWGLG